VAKDTSLDFANTADWHAGPNPEERLTTYREAVAWAVSTGIMSESQGRRLVVYADAHPGEQAKALRRIVALREAIYRIFSAVAHGRPPDAADIGLLNLELGSALSHLRLVAAGKDGRGTARAAAEPDAPRFGWSWAGMEDELTSLLWPVARAATALLTSSDLARVRECADDACGWLFLDHSRNGSRRWCDMADCGNRAKARRYRERRKEESAVKS